MLPPFVPPSARVASENLPLITEFLVDRIEHSFESSFSLSGEEAGGVATLPSIDKFVRDGATGARKPETSPADDEFVQRTSRSPWGTYEAKHEVGGNAAGASLSHAALEPDLLLGGHRSAPIGSQDAIVNQVAEPADAWAASTTSARTNAASDGPVAEDAAAPSTAAPEVWVAEERDAFDWHAAANLATPPAEAQRAADEWSSTEWERSSGSVQDHIAAVLAQLSRRVRSGELEVQGGQRIIATVTCESTRSLGLAPGRQAIALIKASSVLLGVPDPSMKLSARNQLHGSVAEVQQGKVNSEVSIQLAGGGVMVAIITCDSAAALDLKQASDVIAIFKASSVILGTTD